MVSPSRQDLFLGTAVVEVDCRAVSLPISWQAWLCGGSVEILPCSRVGHVYQDWEAHSLVDQEAMLRSKVCLAETWLGSFKETFYRHSPEASSLSQVRRQLGGAGAVWILGPAKLSFWLELPVS